MKEVIYVSDLLIALAWCSSLEKKLRLFVQNRVATILRMVQWTLNLDDGDPLPLYHVDSELNIADLLTKEHQISAQDVSVAERTRMATIPRRLVWWPCSRTV